MEKQKQNVLNRISTLDFSSEHKLHITRRQSHTGGWFLESTEYKTWLCTPGQRFFCPGIAGAGKTVLMATVIDHLQHQFGHDPKVGIAYVYFGMKGESSLSVLDIIASILRQLSQVQRLLPKSVKDAYHDGQRPHIGLEQLFLMIKEVASAFSRVFLVVDALDECQNADFLPNIVKIQEETGASLVATSRPIRHIQEQITADAFLKIRATNRDVLQYLHGRIGSLESFHPLRQSPQLLEEVLSVISTRTDGM